MSGRHASTIHRMHGDLDADHTHVVEQALEVVLISAFDLLKFEE